jgi:hypothetical protein
MKRRSRRKSVRVDGGEQPEAPQSVAAYGDHANPQLGLAAGAQAGAGRRRCEGEIAVEDELVVHRPAAAPDSAGDDRNRRRTRVSLGGKRGGKGRLGEGDLVGEKDELVAE